MFHSRTVEIWVGVFIAAGMAALLVLALKVSNLNLAGDERSYTLLARFDNIGGLKTRAPVTVAGVRVGRVSAIEYDAETYEAVVSLAIESRFDRLPRDTSASILTAGLLGEQYVGLEPGGETAFLKDGERIPLTQSALVLEKIIGQVLFNKAAGE